MLMLPLAVSLTPETCNAILIQPEDVTMDTVL